MPRRLGAPLKPRRITRWEQRLLRRYNIDLPLHTVFHLKPGGLRIYLETRSKEWLEQELPGRVRQLVLHILNENYWKL